MPLAALALAAGVAGCDAQVDPYYPGEPLFTLNGQVAGIPPLPPLEAAMLWQRGLPPSMDDQELATRVPVETSFPATFTVNLYLPPPAAARRMLLPGEVSFARGNVAAIPLGIATEYFVPTLPIADAPPPAYSGADVDHWVIHLEADVPPGSLMDWWLGAPLVAGYHLVRVTPINTTCMPEAELQACVAELLERSVPDEATARQLCLAPYRLSPAAGDETIVLYLGTYTLSSGPCAP